jgi:hypothetical protein
MRTLNDFEKSSGWWFTDGAFDLVNQYIGFESAEL